MKKITLVLGVIDSLLLLAAAIYLMIISQIIIAVCLSVLAIIDFILSILSVRKKGACIALLILGIIRFQFGLLIIIGGAIGLDNFKKKENMALEAEKSEVIAKETKEADNNADINSDILNDYAIDRINKPLISKILDVDDHDVISLKNADVVYIQCRKLYVSKYSGNLYLTAELTEVKEGDGSIVIFRIDYENDQIYVEENDDISEAVFTDYKMSIRETDYSENDEIKIKRSDFKLDLYDVNIDEKTWKRFKKSASQEELAVIAIGAKYRVAHRRILNIIYAIGIVLSIALFFSTSGWSLFGYVIFAFLATKSIRYEDTYGQSYGRLDDKYSAFVDNFFNSNIWLKILDFFVKLCVLWLTIPYQAVLLFIGTFAPNFVISKNGILVSLPKGYDVGCLGAIGEYYANVKFMDEAVSAIRESNKAITEKTEESPADKFYKRKEYTYTDSYGYEQTVYTDNDKDFYGKDGKYVGSAGDGHKFKIKK